MALRRPYSDTTHKQRSRPMAFPPNYRQERNNRDKAKQQKAADKQAEKDARAAERKLAQEQEDLAARLAAKKD
jgi:hypothetical protein